MPRKKQPLYPYHQSSIPVDMATIFGQRWVWSARPKDWGRIFVMFPAALKFLEKHLPKSDQDGEDMRLILFLFHECFEVALHPEVLLNSSSRISRHFLGVCATHTDFMLAYMAELRRLAAKTTDAAKVATALRTQTTIKDTYNRLIPIERAEDKDLAHTLRVSKATVKKTRQELAAFDAQVNKRKKRQ